MNATPRPVVFIHGLWLHASSWGPWADLFSAAGYAPAAPGWPGEPDTAELARANPDSVASSTEGGCGRGHGVLRMYYHYSGRSARRALLCAAIKL